jgi:biopolymer transport protein ExbD
MSRSKHPGATPLMSLVDVVFLLMTFFLFGTVGLRQQQLAADLSRPGDSPVVGRSRTCWLTIRPTSPGAVAYRVDGGPWLDRASDVQDLLVDALAKPDADGTVTIDALPGVAFQSVIDAFALAERGGCQSVALKAE